MRMDGDQKEKYVENKLIDIESVILPQKLVSVGTSNQVQGVPKKTTPCFKWS